MDFTSSLFRTLYFLRLVKSMSWSMRLWHVIHRWSRAFMQWSPWWGTPSSFLPLFRRSIEPTSYFTGATLWNIMRKKGLRLKFLFNIFFKLMVCVFRNPTCGIVGLAGRASGVCLKPLFVLWNALQILRGTTIQVSIQGNPHHTRNQPVSGAFSTNDPSRPLPRGWKTYTSCSAT